MRNSIKKSISIATIPALILLLVVLLHQSDSHRQEMTCEGIRVEYADKYRFVSEQDIKDYLARYYGSYIGQRLDSVDLHKMEGILDDQSAVLKSEAYTTEDGFLNIRLTQREPVLRFQQGEQGFYVDGRGFIFPLQDNFSAHVPIIDGDIPVTFVPGYKGKPVSKEDEAWINDIMKMMAFISRNKTWKEAFVQYHVDSKGSLTLVPREGKEKFIIGRPDGLDAKFGRIVKYYEYIKPACDSIGYSTVNVRYDGQIICKK